MDDEWMQVTLIREDPCGLYDDHFIQNTNTSVTNPDLDPEPVDTTGSMCACYANGQEYEKYCESGTFKDPPYCESQVDSGKRMCHWGPEEREECRNWIEYDYWKNKTNTTNRVLQATAPTAGPSPTPTTEPKPSR